MRIFNTEYLKYSVPCVSHPFDKLKISLFCNEISYGMCVKASAQSTEKKNPEDMRK